MTQSGWRAVAGTEFSAKDSVGGWRGLIESSAPGVVFVVAYRVWGGYQAPTIAACATVAVMVAARLFARQRILHALGGVFGVAIGALWAWLSSDPGGYFVPGFWVNAATLIALLASIVFRWPVVGVVVAVFRGASMEWRGDARLRRRFGLATAILAGLFAAKLAVQLPLYWADEVTALGVAKIAMGIPLFVLTAWGIWLMVRNETLPGTPQAD